jgi:hypothetical protein
MEKPPFRVGFLQVGLPRIKIMYGYRPAEYGLKLTQGERPDASFRVTKIRSNFYNMDKREAVRVSLGCHVTGYSLPVPDLNHGPSILAGCTKRVAADMPPIQPHHLRRFFRFVKRFCNKHLRSLQFDESVTFNFEDWIESVDYPDYRKNELKRVYANSLVNRPNTEVKSFVKNEPYSEPKHFRGIYSRHDDYKVRCGPYFKKFGDRLFALKWFIKKIPLPMRPNALYEKLAKYDKIFCTDFSQYESTFVQELMKIEHWVYVNFALERHPMRKHFNDLFAYMRGTNKIIFKDFDCKLDAKRMSGEMNTSCGNGVMNLLITFFILEQSGNSLDHIDAFFEGDDGIVGCSILPTAAQYLQLGARIKIELPESIATASFCGNVFHPDHKHNVTNPCEASVCFGWTDARKYRNCGDDTLLKLLCAKSMSMLYEYPGCPILKSLARYGLRVSFHCIKKITPQWLQTHSANSYEYRLYKDCQKFILDYGIPDYEIGLGTRLLVENLYGIPIGVQLSVEKYLDSLTTLQPLDLTMLPLPKLWYDTDLRYSALVIRGQKDPFFCLTGFSTPAYLSPGLLTTYLH